MQSMSPADYATRYLRRLYAEYGNWTSAVAYYHSATPTEQWGYVCRVHARLVQYGLAAPGACDTLRTELGNHVFK